MVIGISAKKQHGKDTVAELIQELTSNKFKTVKFADNLKDFVCKLIYCTRKDLENEDFKNTALGDEWDFLDDNCVKQKMTPRLLLQKIGTEGMRNNVHPNIWINATFSSYSEKCNWIITDLRFPNEMEAIIKKQGITIRVNRPSITNNDNHESETSLDNYTNFNHYIINDGTLEDLKIKIMKVLIHHKII